MPTRSSGAVAALVVVTVALASLAAGAVTAGCAAQEARPVAASELLVGFARGTTSAEAEAIYAPLGATRLDEMRDIGVHRIQVAPGSLESVERALKAHPAVRYVERNQQVRPD